MTYETGMHGWLACREPAKAPARPRRRRHRPHADWVLEMALMAVLAALTPGRGRRK